GGGGGEVGAGGGERKRVRGGACVGPSLLDASDPRRRGDARLPAPLPARGLSGAPGAALRRSALARTRRVAAWLCVRLRLGRWRGGARSLRAGKRVGGAGPPRRRAVPPPPRRAS